MALKLEPLIRAVVDIGSESYEARIRKMIILAGMVGLFLILAWKRG